MISHQKTYVSLANSMFICSRLQKKNKKKQKLFCWTFHIKASQREEPTSGWDIDSLCDITKRLFPQLSPLFLRAGEGVTCRPKLSLENIAGDNFERYRTLSKVNRALYFMWRVWEKHMARRQTKEDLSKDETIGTGRLWRAFVLGGWLRHEQEVSDL